MRAWDILKNNSALESGDAWDHLSNQKVLVQAVESVKVSLNTLAASASVAGLSASAIVNALSVSATVKAINKTATIETLAGEGSLK